MSTRPIVMKSSGVHSFDLILREVAALRSAGADVVVSGEGDVALGFTEAILERLGATPEQIDRERARVHAELGQSA